MKHITFLFNDEKDYKKAQKHSCKKKYISQLIQVYSGTTKEKKLQKILRKLQQDFPQAIIVGATTAGEISHATMYEKQIVISLSLFENTLLKATYTKEIHDKSGQKVAKKLCTKDTKAMIVLSEGLKPVNYEKYLNAIKSVSPKIVIAGGLAGDNFQLKKTYIFYQTNIYNKGSVAVSFSSKELYASNQYNLNWSPIGKEFLITKVKHNIVYEIDHIPAVDFFKKYLGSDIFQQDIIALPNFQLLFKKGSITVARTPLSIQGKALVFAAPIEKNQTVQFGFSNESLVIDDAYELQKEILKTPAESIYIFSCIARKTLLGKTLQEEFQAFEQIAPTTGFFTYGEFYSTNTTEALLNCTTTILVLAEKVKKKKIIHKYQHRKTLDSITFNAFSHFIKQTSKELQSNIKLMDQYKKAVDISLLVSKTDPKGFITYVNDNFCKISKYTKEELIGKNHNIVRDPAISKTIFKKMWETIQAGKVYKGIFSNKAKDGSIYYVDATVLPIFNEKGKIEEYIALRKDITKQVKNQLRVQEKERLIRAILDNQDSIVIHASKIKGTVSVNKKLFDFFDFKNMEDFKSRHSCICDLFIEEEGYVSIKAMPNWIDHIAKHPEQDFKVKMKIKDGSIHTFTLKSKKIDNEYILNLYDITKLEQALQQAYSSEKAKSIFLANMSHEIRTPLNGILGFTDVLIHKNLDKEIKKYVDIIHKSGETLLNIVNDILDFSKIESGELSLDIIPADLFNNMEAAVSTFASLSKQKEIHYFTYIDTAIPKTLQCDIQRLKQVMSNLISNAIKFTPKDGEVTVCIELIKLIDHKATIRFSVKDTGIGIPKEKIATIFQPFLQADNSISRKFGGTGLGLAISNQYIEMMGSQIEVKSTPNKGSEFFFQVNFDVLDTQKSYQQHTHINELNISILGGNENIKCTLNKIIHNYLEEWNVTYKDIKTPKEIDSQTHILISCAKLLDPKYCQQLLEEHPTLQLIYIEDGKTLFTCNHPRFFLIEQPMTGSILFDQLISLVDPEFFNAHTKIQQSTQHLQFSGKVIIAEDNETNQLLISIMLKERGIKHTIVNNGQELLKTLEKENFDLILIDINMPIMDGITATKILRSQGYKKPIVSLSANVIESDTQSFKEAGVDDTLNKPIVPKELDAILTTYLPITEKDSQQKDIHYDQIDLNNVSQALSIADITIIKKLFQSLAQTLQNVLEELKEQGISKELIHRLKGAVGNMRLEKLYKISKKLEDNIESMNQYEKENAMILLKSHIEALLQQIKELP